MLKLAFQTKANGVITIGTRICGTLEIEWPDKHAQLIFEPCGAGSIVKYVERAKDTVAITSVS
jgi:hypothetical protein